jgi:hypothetical protein
MYWQQTLLKKWLLWIIKRDHLKGMTEMLEMGAQLANSLSWAAAFRIDTC